ncbi:PepSY-associated TM helix domain-containing protein [Methylobacterium sp. A54F]
MRTGFRQSMAWLHAWSGLVVGWVLFAVFVTGTASYYRPEISRWMRPELTAAAEPDAAALGRAAERGAAHLQAHAGGARTWFLTLPTAERPVLEVFWRTRPGEPPGRALLDPATGAPLAVRDTRGGDFLYRFHFELHMAPLWGRWIVGICAMIMLVALVSGIVTHRRIFTDFFTFRRQARSAQRSWLDAHNVAGVLGLPFHLMITYSGLVTLALMYMPWGVQTAYQGDSQRYFAESGQVTAPRPPTRQPGTLAPLGPMVERAAAMVGEPLERLVVNNPGDAAATVVAVFEEPRGLAHRHPQVAFDGATGAVLGTAGVLGPATHASSTFVGLHEAHFAGPALRALFFLAGLAGTAMVGTGLVLWAVARVPKAGAAEPASLHLVRALNIGTIAGLPIGIAAYFLANRLLPLGLAERAEWEVRAFFAAWLLAALVPLARPRARAWTEMLAAAALAFAAVPLADALTSPHPPLGLMLAFDAAMLALAGLAAFAARKAAGRAVTPAPVRRAAEARSAVSAAGRA